MSDEAKPGNGAVPPKLTLRDTSAIPKKETTRVDLSTAQTPPPVQNPKKSTSRIPLEAAIGSAATEPAGLPGTGSKTIRLTPLAAARPMTIPPVPRPPVPSTAGDVTKRQTSRIPLEAALTEERGATTDTEGTPGTPKTIRIKRPTQMEVPTVATVKLPPPAERQPEPAAAEINAQKSKTARVDTADVPPEGDAGQATQRKTIKIRRAEGGTVARPVPRSVAVARLEAEVAERVSAEQVQVHWSFPLVAAVALVILGVLVVVLAAQAFPGLGWKLPGAV